MISSGWWYWYEIGLVWICSGGLWWRTEIVSIIIVTICHIGAQQIFKNCNFLLFLCILHLLKNIDFPPFPLHSPNGSLIGSIFVLKSGRIIFYRATEVTKPRMRKRPLSLSKVAFSSLSVRSSPMFLDIAEYSLLLMMMASALFLPFFLEQKFPWGHLCNPSDLLFFFQTMLYLADFAFSFSKYWQKIITQSTGLWFSWSSLDLTFTDGGARVKSGAGQEEPRKLQQVQDRIQTPKSVFRSFKLLICSLSEYNWFGFVLNSWEMFINKSIVFGIVR